MYHLDLYCVKVLNQSTPLRLRNLPIPLTSMEISGLEVQLGG